MLRDKPNNCRKDDTDEEKSVQLREDTVQRDDLSKRKRGNRMLHLHLSCKDFSEQNKQEKKKQKAKLLGQKRFPRHCRSD